MKKTFSKFVALLTGVMLLAISCTNASQITYNDLTKTEPSSDGLSTLSIGIASAEHSRTILPGEWDDTAKSKLVYRLYGKADGATVNLTDKPVIFTYDEGKHCLVNKDGSNASVRLDPLNWNLLLVAYNKTSGDPIGPDYNQGVLMAKPVDADLTKGNTSLEFNLGTYDETVASGFIDDTLAVSTATGAFDIDFHFYAGKDDVDTPTSANITITNAALNPDDVTSETKVEGDLIVKNANMTPFGDTVGGSQKTAHYENTILAPNTKDNQYYNIKVEFKNKFDKVILTYRDKLIIDAGNTSKPVNNYIEIPEGAFNGAPAAPGKLSYKFDFVPFEKEAPTGISGSKLTKDNKVVGQKIVDNRASKDTVIDLTENKYNVTFSWKDNSVNEEGFILKLTTDAGESITITRNPTKDGNGEYVPDISVPNTNGIAIADLNGSTAGLANGDLNPGCESITLTIPMGVGITAADIASTNSFIEEPETGIVAGTTLDKSIGMYTVAYKLGDKNGNIKDSYVHYGNGDDFKVQDAESNTYFVKAYEFDTTEDLMGQVKWPAIGNARKDLLFSGWSIEDVTLKPIAKWTELKASTEGTLTTSKYNKNIILYPSWLVEKAIKVNFPDRTEYRDLDVVKNQNPEKTITPSVINGEKIVDIELPYYENSSNEKFTVYGPDGKAVTEDLNNIVTTPKDTSTGAKLTWNVTKWLDADTARAGGIYSIYVEYDYKGTDGNTLPITGYLYVNVER